MAEVEATIPENSEPQDAPEEQAPAAAPPESQPEEPPKRGRGRPAGAKDKAPRSTKPRVRVEPIPQPKAAPAAQGSTSSQLAPPSTEEERGRISQIPPPSTEEERGRISQIPPPVVEERPPSPEPPSPRTLYRQTSAHLLNLRDVMNSQKRASAAERYTARLQAWPVV